MFDNLFSTTPDTQITSVSGRLTRTCIGGFLALAFGVGSLASPLVANAKTLAEMKAEYQRPTSVPYPEDNPYSVDKAELGKKLFFDPRLSGNNQLTCAFCHNPSLGWGDGHSLGFGAGMGRLGRRTPTILNLAWSEPLMWDGRFDTLEEQALGPVGAGVEMAQNLETLVAELEEVKGYQVLFNIAFPGTGISLDNIANAIATFERTVISSIAPFDLWVGGDEDAISASAKRGFELFNTKARCSECHSGWNFTDDSLHDIGLPNDAREEKAADGSMIKIEGDIGRGEFFKDNPALQYTFKTPGLRNLPARAPFMHNGSLHSLEDVISHYNTGGYKRPSLSRSMKPLALTDDEAKDIKSFLLTLVSNDPAVTVPILPR
ncbi:MAG: c-type cytochrome [Rhodospirillales bacterium]|nr:c-type cytochrome [Rhodospirillales bacterium]